MDPATIKALTDLMSPTLTQAAKSATERRAEKAAISDALVGSLVGKLATVLSEADASDLARRMSERESAVKLRKQLNVEECLRLAVEVALGEPPAERRELEQDWFFEWFACVENVSDETIQSVWAHVLANNLDGKRRAVSLRALDTLRLMERADAERLRRFSLLAARVGVLFVNDWSVADATVGQANLEVLVDLGLVSREEYGLGRIGLPNALSLKWERSDGRGLLDPLYAYRLSARGAELAQTLPPEVAADAVPGGIDLASENAYLAYARIVAAGFDRGFRVTMQFNRARFERPNDPVAQRTRDSRPTHEWDPGAASWARLPEADSLLPADLLVAIEAG